MRHVTCNLQIENRSSQIATRNWLPTRYLVITEPGTVRSIFCLGFSFLVARRHSRPTLVARFALDSLQQTTQSNCEEGKNTLCVVHCIVVLVTYKGLQRTEFLTASFFAIKYGGN